MTTIKDLLLSALRDIGADGVAYYWAARTLGEIEPPQGFWPSAPGFRPAFLDADGRLVPLPEGWEVEATGALRGPLIRGMGCPMITRRRDGSFSLRGTSRTKSYAYPTAPEAWAAAEAWLKEQDR